MNAEGKGSTSQANRTMNIIFAALTLGMTLAAVFRTPPPPWHEWVWLGAYWVQGFIRMPHARANAANIITGGNRDLSEKIGLGAMFVTMGMLPLIEVGTGAFAFADYALPTWAAAIGAALQIPFLWLFWRSHANLGRNWSATLEVREGHELVTSGIYARIRHPMYAAIWCAVIAQPLLVQNWLAGLPIVAAFTFMWFVRMPREEGMMRAQFGAAYDAYCLRTGRIWPRWLSVAAAPADAPMPTKDDLRAQEKHD
jgi:protein-S-isoprenylcysteine O-methyltransferase Ste14